MKSIKSYHLILSILIFSVIAWFLIAKGFSLALVWLVEGGWYRAIDRYESWWEGVRMPILLVVGVLGLGFFVASVVVGMIRSREGWRR